MVSFFRRVLGVVAGIFPKDTIRGGSQSSHWEFAPKRVYFLGCARAGHDLPLNFAAFLLSRVFTYGSRMNSVFAF
jgi:hypothetical protein